MDRLRLIPAPACVGQARQFSRNWLDCAGASELADVVTLLVSELVTNVVLHARTDCELTLEHRGNRLRVSVADEDPAIPVRKPHDVRAGSGRGLVMMEAMALESGLERTSRGKQVWCELGWPNS